jgi:hypothetical protein
MQPLGDPRDIGAVQATTDQVMSRIAECLERARELVD